MRFSALPILLILFVAMASAGRADDILPGPIPARVDRVVDGDTVVVVATIWLGQTLTTHVRIAGVDTPELRGDCPAERELARAARDGLADLLVSSEVTLHGVRMGTFAGRVVAQVRNAQGRDVGQALLTQGLARAYDGGGARPGWCGP